MAGLVSPAPIALKSLYTTIMTWVQQIGELLPDAYDPEVLPEVGELDELETLVGSKKQNLDMDSR